MILTKGQHLTDLANMENMKIRKRGTRHPLDQSHLIDLKLEFLEKKKWVVFIDHIISVIPNSKIFRTRVGEIMMIENLHLVIIDHHLLVILLSNQDIKSLKGKFC